MTVCIKDLRNSDDAAVSNATSHQTLWSTGFYSGPQSTARILEVTYDST